jgi:hypothetical protein
LPAIGRFDFKAGYHWPQVELEGKKMAKRKKKAQPDPDLDIWIRLGGGVTESEKEGMMMTEQQKMLAAGNAWAREQLRIRTRMPGLPAGSPFRLDE